MCAVSMLSGMWSQAESLLKISFIKLIKVLKVTRMESVHVLYGVMAELKEIINGTR